MTLLDIALGLTLVIGIGWLMVCLASLRGEK